MRTGESEGRAILRLAFLLGKRDQLSSFRKVRKKPGCCPFCSTPLIDDGTIVYSADNGFLSRWGVSIYLSPIANNLFRALMRGYPNAIERMDLEIAGWGYDGDMGDKYLAVQLCSLRRTLKLIGMNILNHHGSGYYLVKDTPKPKGVVRDSFSIYRQTNNSAERARVKALIDGQC